MRLPGVRHTKQKEAIARALETAKRPLSLEEVIEGARVHYPTLSERTVFRALKEMMESMLVARVQFPGQPIRYSLPTGAHNPHFVCRGCQKLFVLPYETPPLDDLYRGPEGFVKTGGEIVFYGYCPDCAEQADKAMRTV